LEREGVALKREAVAFERQGVPMARESDGLEREGVALDREAPGVCGVSGSCSRRSSRADCHSTGNTLLACDTASSDTCIDPTA
jgi:hypothetical protein